MKSTPTPHTHTGYTSEEIRTQFGATGSHFKYDVVVPPGTKCHRLYYGSDPWVVEDLSFLPRGTLMYSDADVYGIRIPEGKIAHIRHESDRTPVEMTYYGTISGASSEDVKYLHRFGVSVSAINAEGRYYFKASPEAFIQLQEVHDASKIEAYPKFGSHHDLGSSAYIPAAELKAELACHKFWLNSDFDDGREISAQELDVRTDEIADIEARLAALEPQPEPAIKAMPVPTAAADLSM